MAFTLHKYYATINVTAAGQALWNPPSQTLLWPTYFTLVSSAITSVLAAIVLTAYYWSTDAADRIDNWRSVLIWLAVALKISLEITISSSMYATGTHAPANGAQSLWYQTCTATGDVVSLFGFAINLDQYCSMQVRPPPFCDLLIVEMGQYFCGPFDCFGHVVCGNICVLVFALET
jgi:hypothetical protein